MSTLELGVIGNGAVAALIDEQGRYVWMCLPRFDGDPVFNGLLNGDGEFSIELTGITGSEQCYETNTAVLVTRLFGKEDAAIEIVDFAPRFTARGRNFLPRSVVRRVRPMSGQPRIRVRLRPTGNWNAQKPRVVRGINHIRFPDEAEMFRVTTNAPLSYVTAETEFTLDRELNFILGPDESLSDAVDLVARDWMERTTDYWKNWTRRLAVPLDYQDEVIRAAITLKICVYEETGGIVAALTSSVPEHPNSQRTWDYRYCWLRDSYFTVSALNRLSAVGTMEHYLNYLKNIIAHADGGHIQPVYGMGLETDLTENIVPSLPGYRNTGPVRLGNQAAEHLQHDVYGHVVLASAQAFFDRRLLRPAGIADFHQLEKVGERAFQLYQVPDAGIWEYRTRAEIHTSSVLMCWAACDRLGKIARQLGDETRARFWAGRATAIKTNILENAWNDTRKAFTGSYGGTALDASVLLMAEVGFLPPDDPRFVATVERIDTELRLGDHILRYNISDDFGTPETAFTICTFWHIDALARIGRRDEARQMLHSVLNCRTRLGLLSEDVVPSTGELWGNFPQTYSMVGIINGAARLSRPWADVV